MIPIGNLDCERHLLNTQNYFIKIWTWDCLDLIGDLDSLRRRVLLFNHVCFKTFKSWMLLSYLVYYIIFVELIHNLMEPK